jgi:hypothetical protein
LDRFRYGFPVPVPISFFPQTAMPSIALHVKFPLVIGVKEFCKAKLQVAINR